MIKIRTVLLSLAVAGLLAAPGRAETVSTLRLAGSNLMGEKLAADLAVDYAKRMKLPGSRTDTSPDPDEYEIVSLGSEGDRSLRTHIEAHGTNTGFRKLLASEADIWMAARQARLGDIDEAHKRGQNNAPSLDQLLSKSWEHVIALDAMVAAVHPRNPVKSLTLAQLRDIFSGKAKTWSAVGGPELPIIPFSSSMNSSTFDVFCTQIMNIGDIAECQKVVQPFIKKSFVSAEELADEISNSPGAVGFVGFSGVRNARIVGIGTECGTTILPTSFTIKSEEYPLTRRLYFYAPPSSKEEVVQFLEYARSDAAQSVIESAGFVNFRISSPPDSYTGARLDSAGDALDGGRTRVRPNDVHAFEDAVQGASRLPITFRFQPGSDELDNRAQDDLQRLAGLMNTSAYGKMEVVLVGFTQAQGDYNANREVSRGRALAMRDSLAAAFSLNPAVAVGVGPAAPVACNLDPNARFLNQRVEAWVRPAK